MARLHIKRNPREETHTRARVCLLHGARVVCALVKKLSLSLLIYISGERFTEKLLRRLCGPGSRGSRETLCMYKLPPLNSAKGNALRNFLYFHANSPSLFLRSPMLFLFLLFLLLPSLPFYASLYKSVGSRARRSANVFLVLFTLLPLPSDIVSPFVRVHFSFPPLFIPFPCVSLFTMRLVKNGNRNNIWFQFFTRMGGGSSLSSL